MVGGKQHTGLQAAQQQQLRPKGPKMEAAGQYYGKIKQTESVATCLPCVNYFIGHRGLSTETKKFFLSWSVDHSVPDENTQKSPKEKHLFPNGGWHMSPWNLGAPLLAIMLKTILPSLQQTVKIITD